MTAPEAALSSALVLIQATKVAGQISDPEAAADALIEIATGWRELAIEMARHQAMTPRRDDDR